MHEHAWAYFFRHEDHCQTDDNLVLKPLFLYEALKAQSFESFFVFCMYLSKVDLLAQAIIVDVNINLNVNVIQQTRLSPSLIFITCRPGNH